MKTEDLTKLAEMYAAHTLLQLSTVSTYSAGDGKFFSRLKDGSDCGIRRAQKIILWFDANWPEDLEWPTAIPRPSVQPKRRAS